MDASQDELYRKFIEAIFSSFAPQIAISPLNWGIQVILTERRPPGTHPNPQVEIRSTA